MSFKPTLQVWGRDVPDLCYTWTTCSCKSSAFWVECAARNCAGICELTHADIELHRTVNCRDLFLLFNKWVFFHTCYLWGIYSSSSFKKRELCDILANCLEDWLPGVVEMFVFFIVLRFLIKLYVLRHIPVFHHILCLLPSQSVSSIYHCLTEEAYRLA